MNLPEIILKTIFTGKLPGYLIFFVTARCDSKCKTCFYWKEISGYDPEKELTTSEIEKISLNYKGLKFLSLSGGEPFLRHDIADICRFFYSNSGCRYMNIPTNCLQPEAALETITDILKKCPDTVLQIDMSVDALNEKHDDIRGVKGNFSRVIEFAEGLKKLKNNYGNVISTVCCTFSGYNQNDILDIYYYALSNLRVDRFNLAYLQMEPREKKAAEFDINRFIKTSADLRVKKNLYSERSTFNRLIDSVHYIVNEIIIKSEKKETTFRNCCAVKDFIVIDQEGNVSPCEPERNYILGNLREENFNIAEILKEQNTGAFINEKKNTGCSCCWNPAIANSIVRNPAYYLRIVSGLFK